MPITKIAHYTHLQNISDNAFMDIDYADGRYGMLIVGIIWPCIGNFDKCSVDNSIANARYVGIRIADHFQKNRLVGFFIPHTNTAQFDILTDESEEYYHALYNEIYDNVCRAFVLLPGWRISNRLVRDCERAKQQGKPAFELKGYEENDIVRLLSELESWAKIEQLRFDIDYGRCVEC